MVSGQPEGLDIGEAAERLGITVTALRKRIKRGSVYAYKVDDRWRVVLDGDQAGGQPGHPGPDTNGQPSGHPDGQAVVQVYEALVAQLRTENGRLVEQLAVKDEQLRQANVIIAQLTQRPPELAAPVPATNGSTQPVTAPVQASPPPAQVRRPWWRRLWPASAG